MEIKQQAALKRISSNHLIDQKSDELYKPIRQLKFHVLTPKYQLQRDQYTNYQNIVEKSLIPAKLDALQISTQPIDQFKKYRTIAQRQKRYQPIAQQVMRMMESQNHGPQMIIYKYGQLKQSNNGKFKSIKVQKIPENKAHFKQNIVQRIELIDQKKHKDQSYNLFSFLDQPFAYLRQKF